MLVRHIVLVVFLDEALLFCVREVEAVEGIVLEELGGELRTVDSWIGEWGVDIVSVPGADPLAMMQRLRCLSEQKTVWYGGVWGRWAVMQVRILSSIEIIL